MPQSIRWKLHGKPNFDKYYYLRRVKMGYPIREVKFGESPKNGAVKIIKPGVTGAE